jgi:hypothetical protein
VLKETASVGGDLSRPEKAVFRCVTVGVLIPHNHYHFCAWHYYPGNNVIVLVKKISRINLH